MSEIISRMMRGVDGELDKQATMIQRRLIALSEKALQETLHPLDRAFHEERLARLTNQVA